MLWPPEKIQVLRPKRQRSEIDTDEILESIKQNGQLNPIIVTHDEKCQKAGKNSICICEAPILIAGERRLESCKKLSIQVDIKFLENLSPIELQKIEYEENAKRKPLPWRDEAKALNKIHEMYLETDPSWSAKQTAKELSQPPQTIHNAILVAKNISSPILQNATTLTQGAEVLRRFQQDRAEAITKKVISSKPLLPTPDYLKPSEIPDKEDQHLKLIRFENLKLDMASPEEIIKQEEKLKVLNMSLGTWLKANPDQRFDIIHLDLPNESFEIDKISENQIFTDAKALLIWFDLKYINHLANYLKSTCGFFCLHPPIIWFKTDSTQVYDSYESGVVFYKPDKKLFPKKNLYPNTNSFHKPKNVLQHFLSMIIEPNESSFFDPFAKTGNSLLAAKTLNAKSIFGLETNEKFCNEANEKLGKF